MMEKTDFAKRMAALRRQMALAGADYLLIPSADAFQGEYVPDSDRRLAWISGFTGSMGTAVVGRKTAHLFVDGRYTLQATRETDPGLFSIVATHEQPLTDWLKEHLAAGQVLAADPWLIAKANADALDEVCVKSGAVFKLLDANPVDAVWTDRPAPPVSDVVAHPPSFAGEDSSSKCRRAAAQLVKDKYDALLIASPESLCWLMNIRGTDLPYAPLVRAFAILHADAGVDLFLDARRLRTGFGAKAGLHAPDTLLHHLQALGAAGKRVLLDPKQTPLLLHECLKLAGARVQLGDDPCLIMRAKKNPAEIQGARNAHRRDGAAVVRFLSSLKPGVRETKAAVLVDAERAKEKLAQGPSFATIAAFGANGAIVHYRAGKGRDALLKAGGLFLLDSGGQYLDGTTDVTRTVFVGPGKPSIEMKRMFTLVLKGHIALASAVFPKGTTGGQLDVLARQHLWRAGHDYDHGTGHGVGSFLSVHEGPQRIAKSGGTAALEEGMILSIEPGYYKAGAFGIRIENLALVVPARQVKGAERDMLGFEILTLVPIDRKLIAPGLLSKSERHWLNAYQQRVKSALRPALDQSARKWLERTAKPL